MAIIGLSYYANVHCAVSSLPKYFIEAYSVGVFNQSLDDFKFVSKIGVGDFNFFDVGCLFGDGKQTWRKDDG